MPREAPVMTATFLSLLMLISFILPGHGYSGVCGDGDRLFHLTAVVRQNGFQLSTLAMSDRLFALRLFARVARKGSFSAAGRELNIPQSTASRTIATLEREIGVALFVRTTRAVTLTDAGSDFMSRHPALRIDLMMGDEREDLVAEGVDVAFRFGPLSDSTATVRRILAWPILRPHSKSRAS